MSSPVTRHLILRKTSPLPGKPIDSFLMIYPNHITVKAISFILSGTKILSKTRLMFQTYSTQRSCQMAIFVFLLLAIIFVFALSTSILTYTTYFVKSCQTAKPFLLDMLCIPCFSALSRKPTKTRDCFVANAPRNDSGRLHSSQ